MREDRRFVVGKGQFVADVALAGVRHVALVTCPYPAARIVAIDKAPALAMPGVVYVLDGRELAAATLPLAAGLDTPHVPRRPLAVDVARYAGEWVAAVVADTRARAEDAAEAVRVTYERLPFVLDAEEALEAASPPVHADHGSNVLLDRTFVWGRGRARLCGEPAPSCAAREMGPQLHRADRDVRGRSPAGIRGARSSTSGPRSRCRNIPTRPRPP